MREALRLLQKATERERERETTTQPPSHLHLNDTRREGETTTQHPYLNDKRIQGQRSPLSHPYLGINERPPPRRLQVVGWWFPSLSVPLSLSPFLSLSRRGMVSGWSLSQSVSLCLSLSLSPSPYLYLRLVARWSLSLCLTLIRCLG